MNPEIFITSAVALLSGGLLVEIYRSWRDRRRVDLDLFYPTWKEEMQRLQEEIAQLRTLVLALSNELHAYGGDPVRITYTAAYKKDEEDSKDGKVDT